MSGSNSMRLFATFLTVFHLGGCETAPRSGLPYNRVASTGSAQEQRVVAGHTVQVVMVGNGHAIMVDGRVLVTDTEDDRVAIQGVYRGGGRTYVLFAELSGGTACPSLYQAVDLSGSVPLASSQIGNCSDLPRVSITGGALRLSVPQFRAAPAKTFVFKDGRMSH